MAPITLYTASTPNGHKASIIFEELKAAYPPSVFPEYVVRPIKMSVNEQKEDWYLKINPNGRIPAISDGNRGDFKVFESAAIILYLTQHYDKEFKLGFDPVNDPDTYSEALQWIFYSHGGIGPMQGQVGHFKRAAPEKIPYAIKRYEDEVKRLYSVVETRLQDRDYLVGPGRGKYSIADINMFPWVNRHAIVDIENFDAVYPNVSAWLKRIGARPVVEKALGIPGSN